MIEPVMTGITSAVGSPLAIPVLLLFVAIFYATAGVDVANISISILTMLLLPVLQHSQTKDTLALQVKLDALIAASDARNDFIGIDRKSVEDIERLRDE